MPKSEELGIDCETPNIHEKNGGRPKGSTNIRKHHLKEVVLAAKNEIAKSYLEEKDKYNRQGKRLPKKWLDEKIVEVSMKRYIPADVTISPYTIRNRKPANWCCKVVALKA